MESKKPTSKELLAPAKNYMKIEFGYDRKIVLPYIEGTKLLTYFEHAEQYNTDDYNNPKITPLDHNFEVSIISQNQYLKLKMASLLDIPSSAL